MGALLALWATLLLPVHGRTETPATEGAVILGVASSLTSLEGRESLQAVTLAVETINAAGGVFVGGVRRPLAIETVDLMDALPGVAVETALQRFEDFCRTHELHAILVGPFRSEVFLPAMDIVARYRIPMLGTVAMTSALEAKVMSDRAFRYVFRLGLNTKYLTDYLIESMRFLKERFDFRRIYIMSQDVAWARSTAALMIKWYFKPDGWDLLGSRHYPSDARDFADGLQEAALKRAQVILPIFDTPRSGRLVTQWKSLKIPAILCGFISPVMGPGAWQRFDGRIDGTLSVVFELGNLPSSHFPPATAFYDAFERRFGRPIESGHGPAPAYESVHVLAAAVERADSLDPDRLVTALEATDRVGAMGRIRFHKGHQVIFGDDPAATATACLIQWTADGTRRIVYPPALAESEIALPAFVAP